MKKTAILLLIAISFAFNATSQNVSPSNANWGIGTGASPGAKLHINTSNDFDMNNCQFNYNPGLMIQHNKYGGACSTPVTGTPSDMFLIRTYDFNQMPGSQFNTIMKVDNTGKIGLGMNPDPAYSKFSVQMGENAYVKSTLQVSKNLHINSGSLTIPQLYTLNGYRFAVNSGNSKMGGDVDIDGKVSIGTLKADAPYNNYMLSVDGDIISKRNVVQTANWADYVFDEDYALPSLDYVDSYIAENNHLPEMPSEAEVTKNGLDVGEMLKMQQQKIEELTLYIIEMNKKISKLESGK